MPPIVIPNGVRAVTIWNFQGVAYAVNVHHYINIAAVTIDQAAAELADITYKAQFVASTLANSSAPEVALASVSLRDLNVANQPEFVGTSPAEPGIGTADPLPLAVSLVATLRTAMAGRRFRGRHYQPGWDEESNTTTGQASAGAQADLVTFLEGIQTDMALDGLLLGVASTGATEEPTSPGGPRGPLLPPSIQPVVAIDVRDGVWDTQRRRAYPGI